MKFNVIAELLVLENKQLKQIINLIKIFKKVKEEIYKENLNK
jgi:hypothetical protein